MIDEHHFGQARKIIASWPAWKRRLSPWPKKHSYLAKIHILEEKVEDLIKQIAVLKQEVEAIIAKSEKRAVVKAKS